MIDLEFPKSIDKFIEWYVGTIDELDSNSFGSYQRNVYNVIIRANMHTHAFGCETLITRPSNGIGFRWKCASGEKCPDVTGIISSKKDPAT